jgi:hypothetical protein
LLRDAKQELAAMKASDAGAVKGGDENDEEDDDDFDDDDEYRAEDLVMVPAITSLVGMAQQLLHAVYGYVLKTAPSAPAAGAVTQLLTANSDASAAAAASSASAAAAASSSLSSMVESSERVAWLEAVLAQARSLVVGVDETVAAVGDEEGVTLAAVQKLTQQCRLLAASVVRHHRATPGAKWPMSAPAAAASAAAPAEDEAAPAWSQCVACQSIVSDIEALPPPSADSAAEADAPTAWLRKVVAALHQAHADAEKAAADAAE